MLPPDPGREEKGEIKGKERKEGQRKIDKKKNG